MNKVTIKARVFKFSLVASFIGLCAFLLSWNVFGGNMPGYTLLLFPGNLFLKLFTEELDFALKLVLLICGQFIVTAMLCYLVFYIHHQIKLKLTRGKSNL